MLGATALLVLLAAMVALVAYGDEAAIMGLAPDQFAAASALFALALLGLGWVGSHFRGRGSRAVEAAVFWLVLLAALVGAHAYRFELAEVASRLGGAIVPSTTATGPGGEVTVTRAFDGHFAVAAQVNGAGASFLFDTGASAIVLTSETAARAGLRPADLDFRVAVATANGRTTAAPVTLDRVTIGPIVERRVRALVARPGTLSKNLLGLTFLERLVSYEVRGDRLILRGRRA